MSARSARLAPPHRTTGLASGVLAWRWATLATCASAGNERRRRGRIRSGMRRVVGVFVACSLIAVIVSGCGGGRSSRTIEVTIGTRRERLPLGTTLAAAAKAFHLAPRAGDLLDVNGRVLRRGAFPGHLVVDGRRVAASTRLASGSRLAVVAGRTHTEQLRRQVLPVAGGSIADPQFTLSRTPGVDV